MIARAAEAAARVSLEPALVRLGAFAAGLVALLIAAPSGLPGVLVAGQVMLAVLPALWPRGPWVTVVVLAAVVAWLAETGLTTVAGGGGLAALSPARLLVLAGALYLLHSLATLAATLPYDAVVVPDLLIRWLLRPLGVIVVSSLLSVALLAALTGVVEAAGRTAYVAVTLAGLAVAVALARLLRGRRRDG